MDRYKHRDRSRSRPDEGISEGELIKSDNELDWDQGSHSRRHREKQRQDRKSHRKERRRSTDSSDGRTSRDDRRHRKKRHRRKSTSRSRSRSKSKSGEYRRRHRKRHRSRSRSSDSRDSNDSWNYNRWEREERPQESYKNQEPNNTIMVRGLAPHLSENDIRQDLLKCGTMVKDIRLIRHRDTGSSRGFAFVEFHTVSDATNWMEMKKGTLILQDQFESNLIYSISKTGNQETNCIKYTADWYCSRCRAYNFKRRDQCYKCNEPRPDDEGIEFYNEISVNPTNTIMLFELDTLTTEEGVLQAFQNNPALAVLPIRSVRIPRESGTNLSRRVCYVESNNVADAMRLYAIFTRDTLEIDDVKVQVAYHKPNTAPVKNSAAAIALAAAQWTNNTATTVCSEVVETDTEKMAEYSASLYAKNETEFASYLEYYREYYKKEQSKAKSGGGGEGIPRGTCSSEITSASSRSTAVEIVASGSQSEMGSTELRGGISTPDPSKFQYDEVSGYYYDANTGYHFDATTQYYYDSNTQKFLLWDSELNNYVAISGNDNEKTNLESYSNTSQEVKKKIKPKVKVAKNVAKEMEKWAKTLNSKRDPVRYTETDSSSLQGRSGKSELQYELNIGSSSSSSRIQHLARESTGENMIEIEEDSSSNDKDNFPVNEDNEIPTNPSDPRYIDLQKIACLLCKRQFSTTEILLKHTKMSELHKQNLAEVVGIKSYSPASNDMGPGGKAYRDRAKERRLRFGTQNEVASNSLKDLYMKVKEDIVTNYVEEPTKQGIKEDNIGNRMLQKMGWQAGQGLGKNNKGIIDPIMAERRVAKVGLGLDVPGALDIEETDDRQTKARKLTLARYMKLD